ncbi:AAA family ATPase [Nonomuraea purpurea]|uniref:AAA family ATPase n=1 Tax=Nonomuraea purpurea TaxID=1849276 RepID=A0ABV8G4M9_9ACTN
MHALPQTSDLLIGRDHEARRVAELATAARAGRGGALVLIGEAGIGKTAILENAAAGAADFRVVRASGAEFEKELPYAALHQLCVPILRHLGELPDRQREALQVAFGLTAGAPDPFRVGVATLELFAAAARERPLVCLVDDAQWLDAASSKAMAFLARRVAADPIAMLFALRLPARASELDELPRLTVSGLSDEFAKSLLAARSPFPLDERVRDRLVAEAHGNPLALLQLPRAGGFALPETSSVPSRIEQAFQSRLAGLPDDARMLLTLASADPTGDPALLWPAARVLGLDIDRACADAAAVELAEFTTRIRFCHPLARSAVYRAAEPDERRAVHGALAEVTSPVVAPDRKAWHRAQATLSPDHDVATELERCASRAHARGGIAAAAAFLERSAALSPDIDRRIGRTLDAAQAHLDAGTGETATALLTTLETATLDEFQRARVELLRGRIAFTRPNDDTGPALVAHAAQRLSNLDPDRSRECYLDALEMCLLVGRGGGFIRQIMDAARSAPAPSSPDVLDALIALAADQPRTAIAMFKESLHGEQGPLWTRWPAIATMISVELWDPDAFSAIAEWLLKAGRESGSPVLLRLGLAQKAADATLSGDVGQALAAVAEEGAIADAAGEPPLVFPRLQLAAMRGRRDEAHELLRVASKTTTADGMGRLVNQHSSTAMLYNGLGDFPAALAAARRATEHDDLFLAGAALPELIEAAMRCREPAVAAQALERLTERTQAGGTTAGRGVAAYSRALVTGAEEHYLEAVECLAETSLASYRGRAHLLYGEWLRRKGRRNDCVRRLRLAHEELSAAGADAFARRAADELRAAGERVDRHAESTYEKLTLQEVAVARLVASGATSNEVAAQLFISKRTVDAHLRNIFRKLGIHSRRRLKDHPGLVSQDQAPSG